MTIPFTLLTLSIVFNCVSDTEALGLENDVLLSTTYFTSKPWTFSVMYGCDSDSSEDLVNIMKRFKKSAFHPLMMPMAFADHERSRFMTAMELKGPKVKERMIDLKNSLEEDNGSEAKRSSETARDKNKRTTQRDWESTNSWVEASDLKIGMESFRKVLVAIKEQFEIFGHLKPRLAADDTDEKIIDSMGSEIIQCRLKEMDAELDTKIRECDGLLNGMTLAIQVVSKFLCPVDIFKWLTSYRNGTTTRDVMQRQTSSLLTYLIWIVPK
jgi:hypothetical protein